MDKNRIGPDQVLQQGCQQPVDNERHIGTGQVGNMMLNPLGMQFHLAVLQAVVQQWQVVNLEAKKNFTKCIIGTKIIQD